MIVGVFKTPFTVDLKDAYYSVPLVRDIGTFSCLNGRRSVTNKRACLMDCAMRLDYLLKSLNLFTHIYILQDMLVWAILMIVFPIRLSKLIRSSSSTHKHRNEV